MPDASTQTQTSPQPCFNPFASTSSLQRPATKPRRKKNTSKAVFSVNPQPCFTLFGGRPPPDPMKKS